MEPPPARLAIKQVAAHLEEVLGAPAHSSRLKGSSAESLGDAEISFGDTVFIVEYKASGDVAGVAAGVRHFAAYSAHALANRVPLLIVPFMSEGGRRI